MSASAAALAAMCAGAVVETAAREATALIAEAREAWAAEETDTAGGIVSPEGQEAAEEWMAKELIAAELPRAGQIASATARGCEDLTDVHALAGEAVRAAHATAAPRIREALRGVWTGKTEELVLPPAGGGRPKSARRIAEGGAGSSAGGAAGSGADGADAAMPEAAAEEEGEEGGGGKRQSLPPSPSPQMI